MLHPTKKQKVDCYQRDVVVTDNDFAVSFDDLSDVLPNIFAFLPVNNIMRSRRINKKTREAVTKTIVPLTDFLVDSVDKCNAMNIMTRALPNLQQITLGSFGIRHIFRNGEDPYEWWADRTADYTTHDIEIISNFSKLRVLTLWNADVNGRYPFLFNSFPLLQTLSIQYCGNLKWDLEMLVGFPVLKELICCDNHDMTGNISSLRVLKDTLETVYITGCVNVEGNFMDLADLPNLIELNLFDTAVTGDIRDIGENDYSSLEHLILPERVYGAKGYELQRISDAPDLVRTVYRLKKQRPALEMQDMDQDWYGKLSDDSPDWYDTVEEDDDDDDTPPFFIYFVKAGLRVGYWWRTEDGKPCEVNWLDPEPDRDSSDYAKYIEELQEINNKVNMFMYKGFHQPPTEEEYNRLCEEYR